MKKVIAMISSATLSLALLFSGFGITEPAAKATEIVTATATNGEEQPFDPSKCLWYDPDDDMHMQCQIHPQPIVEKIESPFKQNGKYIIPASVVGTDRNTITIKGSGFGEWNSVELNVKFKQAVLTKDCVFKPGKITCVLPKSWTTADFEKFNNSDDGEFQLMVGMPTSEGGAFSGTYRIDAELFGQVICNPGQGDYWDDCQHSKEKYPRVPELRK